MSDTILIVDDSVEVITSLSAILKDDYSVCASKSGEAALELLNSGVSVQLVLLDLSLPGIDGFTVCRHMQESPLLSDIPVIIITATSSMEVETQGLKEGAVDFITKPINPPTVRERIKNHIFIYNQKKHLQSQYNFIRSLHTSLVDNAPMGITFLDEKLNVQVWNRYLEDCTGCAITDMNFKRLQMFFPAITISQVKRLRERNESVILEDLPVRYRKDESERIVRVHLSGFSDSSVSGGILLMITDITDRIVAEREQKKLREQLLQSQKMEAMGTLAGGIAHDFNNILGVIIGAASLLFHNLHNVKELKQVGDEILSAAYRAKDLVGQILTFSRKRINVKENIFITNVIDETISFMKASLPPTVEITKEVCSFYDVVEADSTELHQVLMNLCTNSFHAMRRGVGPAVGSIKIKLEDVYLSDKESGFKQMMTGHYHHITVMDDGNGIPEKIISRIFDPYFTTKDVGKGTGLGLSVVQGIIVDHGGLIEVDSIIGKGTSFHVYLPISTGIPEKSKIKPVLSDSFGMGVRIFIVDDEKLLTRVVTKMLESTGFQVAVEHNPVSALEHLAVMSGNYDLAIIDKSMPLMSGYQLAESLRDMGIKLPLLLSTGYLDPEERAGEQMKLFAGAIQKPYQKSELVQAIREVLKPDDS